MVGKLRQLIQRKRFWNTTLTNPSVRDFWGRDTTVPVSLRFVTKVNPGQGYFKRYFHCVSSSYYYHGRGREKNQQNAVLCTFSRDFSVFIPGSLHRYIRLLYIWISKEKSNIHKYCVYPYIMCIYSGVFINICTYIDFCGGDNRGTRFVIIERVLDNKSED